MECSLISWFSAILLELLIYGFGMKNYTSYFEHLPDELKPQTSIPVGELHWKTLEDYPDYEISTFGSVRRINPGKYKKHHLVGNILIPYLVNGTYPEVELSYEGKSKKEKIHILIAKTFIEKKPKVGDVVRHLDHRPQVPTAWSVGWGTQKENIYDRDYHRLIHILHNQNEDLMNCASLLVDIIVNGISGRDASKKWGVSYSKINKLRSGKRHGLELKFLRNVLERVSSKN